MKGERCIRLNYKDADAVFPFECVCAYYFGYRWLHELHVAIGHNWLHEVFSCHTSYINICCKFVY